MTTPKKPTPAEQTGTETPAPDQGLAHLLAEMQGLALVLPPVDRTDAEIEADFDNMPV
ncbi:hypothetical protein SAMN05878503_11547 [Cereibacter ovatus]|uniref:Uncharacterized protein n=1 Tax=Cereibacter ovatus TaxID=439529 RepID=A0A285D0I3_9RHOB|nr:hypothetical protein [Cereibacter ovatus]SNX73357.1 hypothetical protein SAMN05878503_11547 [Cereibacter ovatus]